jgi:hypothetical protein
VVPRKALYIAQIQIAKTESPIPPILGKPNQPVGNHVILSFALGLVSVAGLTHLKGLARQLDRYPTLSYCLPGHLAALRWPQNFFANAS